MALVRLDARFVDLEAAVDYANEHHVVLSIIDADPIVGLGSLHDQVTSPLGVWLEISEEYPAQLAARDVKTLSWLVPLDTVVVSSASGEASAQVLEALLSDDEVNFTNDAATLVAAYNRPAPPGPVAVWSWDGTVLRSGVEELLEESSVTLGHFDVTTYR